MISPCRCCWAPEKQCHLKTTVEKTCFLPVTCGKLNHASIGTPPPAPITACTLQMGKGLFSISSIHTATSTPSKGMYFPLLLVSTSHSGLKVLKMATVQWRDARASFLFLLFNCQPPSSVGLLSQEQRFTNEKRTLLTGIIAKQWATL